MKVLVTGGAGYVGTELIKHLARQDQTGHIVVYDNLSRGNYNAFLGEKIDNYEKIEFVKGDILDSRKLRKVLQGVEMVYHLAARVTTPFANTDPHFYEQINHWGTAELVYALEEMNGVHLVHLSSTSVYGSTDEVVSEASPLQPRTFYGISKKRGEEHVMRLVEEGQATIIRCGNVYGYSTSMRFDAVINKYAFETNFHNRIIIQGNGHQSRAFVHVDHLTAVLARLNTRAIPAGVFNMVANNYEILDLVDGFKQLRPGLEFIFVDQHLELRNLRVSTDLQLSKHIDTSGGKSLTEDIEVFLNKFSF
jgi:UDP-glucose 4-epimerase